MKVCDTFKLPGITKDATRLCLFSFLLKDGAKKSCHIANSFNHHLDEHDTCLFDEVVFTKQDSETKKLYYGVSIVQSIISS